MSFQFYWPDWYRWWPKHLQSYDEDAALCHNTFCFGILQFEYWSSEKPILVELRKLNKTAKSIEEKLKEGLFDPNAPTNSYGEGLVDGIQNGIARGLQGISTYR